MKWLTLVAFLGISAASAFAEDFRITVEPRKTGLRPASAVSKQEGIAPAAAQTWSSEIKIENVGRQPSGQLHCKYVLYIKRQELGGKVGEEKTQEVPGEFDVSPLKRGAFFSANTNEVNLRQQSLSAGYYVKGGGQGKASDTVQGVWVKLFDGSKEVAEFVNPPTIKSKFQWK